MREITIFLVIIALLLVAEYFIFTARKSRFSQPALETIITQQSNLREQTDDPCKYPIYGEPEVVENRYIKLRIECVDGRVAASTLDPRAISGTKVKDVLVEFARVSGFVLKFGESGPVSGSANQEQFSWDCQYNQTEADYQQDLIYPAQINCVLMPYEN